MAIKIGNNDITLKLGSADVSAAYIGDTLVYSGGTPPAFQGKWLATYQDSHTESAQCDSSSAITYNEINLTNLVSVEIGDNCVTSIGGFAFYDCRSITSCTIGSGVTSIGDGAFNACSSLTSIDIPSSVTSIGSNAFYDCSGLTSCTIGSGVTSIGGYAFQYCSGLTSIVIPDSVTSIGNQAFYYCSGMTTCTIGSGVTSIGSNAFNNCSSLTSITVNATTPPTLGGNVFIGTNNCPIYVPAASVEAYKTASGWNDYVDRITAIPT